MRSRTSFIWALAILQLWLAHAIGFMIHEYAHSFTAWLLHAKSNPLALDYGHWTLDNVLFQEDIDENVNYAPIFVAGHGATAAVIAVAGVLFGNGLSYVVSRWLLKRAEERNSRLWAMFFFWICVMSVGNFLSYVPLRTFATHADMATTAQGLHVSAWVIALGLGIPFGVLTWHFFAKILPHTEAFLFQKEPALQGALVLMTTYIVFFFFGGSGSHNYGPTSYWLSIVSRFVILPIVTVLCLQRARDGLSGKFFNKHARQ